MKKLLYVLVTGALILMAGTSIYAAGKFLPNEPIFEAQYAGAR